jgi:hypothetical protein
MKISPTEIFKGKKIFFIGGTGIFGKARGQRFSVSQFWCC